MKAVCSLVLTLCLALPGVVLAETEHTVQATFNGEMTLLEVELPPIGIEGSLNFTQDNLRVEFIQDFTQESVLMLVDFSEERATVLYPDTLNGLSADLASLGFAEYIKRLRDLLATPMEQEPPGWELKLLGSSKVNGQEMSRLRLTHPEGAQVEYLLDDEKLPRQVEVTTPGWLFVCQLPEIEFDAELNAELFTYDEDNFAVREWQSADDERLPPI